MGLVDYFRRLGSSLLVGSFLAFSSCSSSRFVSSSQHHSSLDSVVIGSAEHSYPKHNPFLYSAYPSSFGWDADGDGVMNRFDPLPFSFGPFLDVDKNGVPSYADVVISPLDRFFEAYLVRSQSLLDRHASLSEWLFHLRVYRRQGVLRSKLCLWNDYGVVTRWHQKKYSSYVPFSKKNGSSYHDPRRLVPSSSYHRSLRSSSPKRSPVISPRRSSRALPEKK